MKIPALLTCLLAMLLAAVPLHRAQADEVNFDVFYNSLADDGDWYNTPEYGYVWQPFVAYKTDKWRPYSDGYWAQTDGGWTWVSYENFGWATYHYGRWTRLKDTGWVWVPGYDWGPGWVSWRTNDDYVGWAPLPPKVEEGVSEGRYVEPRHREVERIDYNDVEPEDAGYGTNVDVQYDIGPANYCFVETRNFGAPVLGEVLLPPQQNFVFIERTRNVTNIYYRRERDRTVVYNNGPDFGFINSHVERPIPRLQLERRDDPVFLRDGLRGGGNPTQVRNGVLQVATPLIARQPINFAQVKPTRIKQTLTQPQVARGWSNNGNTDQAAGQRIREQYKQQAAAAPARPANPVIPPAAVESRDRTERAAGNTPPAPAGAQPFVSRPGGGNPPGATAPRGPLTEEERLARRDARQKERDQRAGGQPAAAAPATGAGSAAAQENTRQGARPNGQPFTQGNPANPATPGNAEQEKEARRAARQAARANAQATPPAGGQSVPAAQGNAEQEKEARRAARQAARANGQAIPAAAAPAEAAQPNANVDQEKEARRAARQAARANGQPAQPSENPPGQNNAPNRTEEERAARRAARESAPAAQPQGQANPQADQEREARRAARQQERAAQPAAQPQANPQADQEREARRAARQQERAAQPAPQAQQPQPDQEARRAARQQERAAQPAPQAQQAQPDQEARRAARQQERAAQPAAPQAQPQNGGNREARQEAQGRPGKPGQSPAP